MVSGHRRGASALTALALLSGCAYHAGTAAAEDFDAWVKDHPVRGARIVDTVGNDKYAFAGELTAYARLTADPSDAAITAAMEDLCAYDDVADVPTTYWLQVERISVQVICTDAGRASLVGFYDAVAGLTTLTHVYLDPTGIQGEAPDAVVPEVAAQVFAAADASGTVGEGATYTFEGEHVRVTAEPGVDLTTELGTAAAVLPVVGAALTALKVTHLLVVAETTGSVSEATNWERQVPAVERSSLIVTPDRVTTDVALSDDQRALVYGLSHDPRVTLVSTYPEHWAIDVADLGGARALLAELSASFQASGLGELTLEQVVDYRRCYVLPDLADSASKVGDALLGLCEREDMPSVDGRFGYLEVRMTGDDLLAVLKAAHTMPAGTEVAINSEGAETSGHYEFTTGTTLVFGQEFDSDNALQQLWATLGPYPG